jgi:PAS domain S-box-containing protein
MPPDPTGVDSADAEQAQLRERFLDAEALCHALQKGEVDAFVVGRSDEEKRVLFLSAAYAGYRRLVEEMTQGALTVSSAGDVYYANRAFTDLLGIPAVLPLGANVDGYVSPHDRSRVRTQIAGGARDARIDVALLRRDGSEVPVRLGVVSASEEFTTLVVTPVESAEAQEARATLDAIRLGGVDAFVVGGERVVLLDSAQAPYRALVERMKQGAVTVQDGGTIVYVNDRFSTMVGAPTRILMGSRLVDVVDPLDQASFREFLDRGAQTQIEVRIRAADRSRRTMLVGMTPLGAHRLLLFSDISERKRHAASEELNRRFLGVLAEEFTALLAPIAASVQTLRPIATKPEAARALDVVQRQTQRLADLVADLRRVNPKD